MWVPGAATADRGYGEAKVDEELREPGVNTIVNPHKGKPVGGPPRRRARPWVPPAGQVANIRSEGGISYLKHRYGWDRSRLDAGARTWCGLRVIAHNSVEIAALIQTRQAGTANYGNSSDRATAWPAPAHHHRLAPHPHSLTAGGRPELRRSAPFSGGSR